MQRSPKINQLKQIRNKFLPLFKRLNSKQKVTEVEMKSVNKFCMTNVIRTILSGKI